MGVCKIYLPECTLEFYLKQRSLKETSGRPRGEGGDQLFSQINMVYPKPHTTELSDFEAIVNHFLDFNIIKRGWARINRSGRGSNLATENRFRP